jgi:hypothetical protein
MLPMNLKSFYCFTTEKQESNSASKCTLLQGESKISIVAAYAIDAAT